jgi:hypothetical protein
MAVQISDVARQAVAQLGLDSGYELSAQFCGQAYAELCSRAKFRHLRKLGTLYMPAPIQTGTCTITFDSPTITLDATALAACEANQFLQWPDGFEGLFFRPQIGITWYQISRAYVDPSTGVGTVVLTTPFAFDNSYLITSPPPPPPVQQAGVTFYILPRFYALAPDARQLGVFGCDFVFRPLQVVSEDQLNMMVPSRFLVSTYPQFVAEMNSNLDQTGVPKQVEIYPPPTNSVTVHYTYYATPKILQWEDFLPPTIDPDTIRSGAMAQIASNRSGKAVRAGNLEEAAYWRNVSNQERTAFEAKIPKAIRNDRGIEDIKFLLKGMTSNRYPLDWDPNRDAVSNWILRGY